jgi:acyl dehydratase
VDHGRPAAHKFAQCSDDRQWIHVDAERAAEERPFGGTIAHGFPTLPLLAPTIFEIMFSRVEIKEAINYGPEKVRFLAPVRARKRVRNRVKVAAPDDGSNGRTLLTTENTVEI